MVLSSFNIQYQSTGIGSLPSLDEIELRSSVRDCLEALMALSGKRARMKFFLESR